MIKPPWLPPVPPDPVRTIGILKWIWNKVKEIFIDPARTSEKVGQSKQLKADAEISDVSELNRILTDYLAGVESKADELEQKLLAELSYFLEEFIDFLKENQESLFAGEQKVSRVEEGFARLKSQLSGSLKKEIARRMSLDNEECRAVLKMVPGEQKKERMNAFTEKVLKEGLEHSVAKMKDAMERYSESIEMWVEDAMERVDMSLRRMVEQYELLQSEAETGEEQRLAVRQKAEFMLSTIDLGVQELKKG